MISYREILQETTWETDTNFQAGIRQLRWIATWLRKARIKNPNNTQEFVIQVPPPPPLPSHPSICIHSGCPHPVLMD